MSTSSYRAPGVTVNLRDATGSLSSIGTGDRLLVVGASDQFPESSTEVVRLFGNSPVTLSDLDIDDAEIVVTRSNIS